MPQTKPQPQQSKESDEILIEEVNSTALKFALPEAGLLPARQGRPLMICPHDNLKKVIPRGKKHERFLKLCLKIRPGSGKIDYLRVTATKTRVLVEIQLQAELNSHGVRARIEAAIEAAGYKPKLRL